MKNYLKKLFNSSIFSHVQRMVIVCVFLSYAVAVAASGIFYSKDYFSSVNVVIDGEGTVYVSKPKKQELASSDIFVYKKTESGTGSAPASVQHSYTIEAKAQGNYYFDTWVDGSTNVNSNPHSFSITTSYTNEETAVNAPNKIIKAIFKPYISIEDKINFIVYSDGIDNVTFNIKDIYRRNSLTLTLKGDDKDKFKLGKSNTDINYSTLTLGSTEGLSANATIDNISVYLSYSDGDYDPEKALAVGDNTYLEIKDNENHTWTVPIRTTAPESFTFLAGENGKYTVVFANSDKTTISNITTDQDPTYLRSDMYTIASLTATGNSGYKFFGWQMVDESGNGTYFSYEAEIRNMAFDGGTKIRPVFIPADQAIFVIKEDEDKIPYYDLQEALDVASDNASYSTVVFNAPTKGTTGTLYPKDGGSAYTIPKDVTLLIPGDAAYTCRTKYSSNLPDSDFPVDTVSSQYSHYSKLILANNTKITLQGGNICVYSTLSSAQPNNGSPIRYGWIEMGENCEIATTNAKQSYLYVLGYITGPKSLSSSIKLNEGSIAYEAFQMPDFRGGSALSSIVDDKDYGVFPSEQFYMQNIEVPMKIKLGAILRGMMPANVTLVGIVKGEIDIVAQKSGLIQLTSDVELIKYYDSERDVQVYQVIGKGANQSSAKLGNVSVNITGIKMDTKDFVLPITSNMEIILDGVTMSSANRVGMLAGSKIWIKENAILNQSAQFYVHDKVENKYVGTDGVAGSGYFGSKNEELIPVRHTPNGTHRKRTVKDYIQQQVVQILFLLRMEHR